MNVFWLNKDMSFSRRWTLTRFGLKAPGRPVLTKEWHLTPSWLVESSTQFALSIRMMTARQEVTLCCTPTIPTVAKRNPSTSLFPTPISTSPLWTIILETTSFTYGTITMCYDTNWSLDPRIRLQVRILGSLFIQSAIDSCSRLPDSVWPAGSSCCPILLIAFCAWNGGSVPQVMQNEQLVLYPELCRGLSALHVLDAPLIWMLYHNQAW